MKRNESTETAVSSEYDWLHTNKMLYKWIIRNVLLASDLQLMWKDMAWEKKKKSPITIEKIIFTAPN